MNVTAKLDHPVREKEPNRGFDAGLSPISFVRSSAGRAPLRPRQRSVRLSRSHALTPSLLFESFSVGTCAFELTSQVDLVLNTLPRRACSRALAFWRRRVIFVKATEEGRQLRGPARAGIASVASTLSRPLARTLSILTTRRTTDSSSTTLSIPCQQQAFSLIHCVRRAESADTRSLGGAWGST